MATEKIDGLTAVVCGGTQEQLEVYEALCRRFGELCVVSGGVSVLVWGGAAVLTEWFVKGASGVGAAVDCLSPHDSRSSHVNFGDPVEPADAIDFLTTSVDPYTARFHVNCERLFEDEGGGLDLAIFMGGSDGTKSELQIALRMLEEGKLKGVFVLTSIPGSSKDCVEEVTKNGDSGEGIYTNDDPEKLAIAMLGLTKTQSERAMVLS